jgi:hypothetical protein
MGQWLRRMDDELVHFGTLRFAPLPAGEKRAPLLVKVLGVAIFVAAATLYGLFRMLPG